MEKTDSMKEKSSINLHVGLCKTQINLSENGKSSKISTHRTGQNLNNFFSNSDKFVPNSDKFVRNSEKPFRTQINLFEFC